MKILVSLLFGFCLSALAEKLSDQEKQRCEKYTSIFENDTTDLQYGYCEDIQDGRGYTSGRAGFCTGTGDAAEVVKKYTAHVPQNPLGRYIPQLIYLANQKSGDTSNLIGYCEAWAEAAKDEIFRKCQDAVSDELYYEPAMKKANETGVATVLGRCAFYDTIIQHGGGVDSNSFGAIVTKTEKEMKGLVNNNEEEWVSKFLENRKKNLQNQGQSTDRVDAMITLANQTNWNMDPPMHIKTKHHDKVIE